MIQFIDGTEAPDVGILVDGRVTEEDVRTIADLLSEAIEKHGAIRVLLQLDSIAGIEPKAFLEDLKFSVAHLRDIERAALVGDQSWLAPYAKVVDALFSCEVKAFGRDAREEGWKWLREGRAA